MAKPAPPPLDQSGDAEAGELDHALQDVAFQLTHGPSDTGRDLRDAAAFAPIATVKGLVRLVDGVRARPGRIWAIAGVLLLAAGIFTALRKAR